VNLGSMFLALRKGILLITAAFLAIAFQSANAQSKDSFQVAYFTIDITSQPRLLITDLTNLLSSPEGRIAAGVVAAYFGVSPAQVNSAISVARDIHDQVVVARGEEHAGRISFDEKYSICRVVAAGLVSQTCGSHIGTDIGGADGHQVTYYAAVPIKNAISNDRCWVQANFVALLVKRDLKAQSNCSANNDRVMDCAGDACAFGPGVKKL
jgi:hypothetical protein